MRFPSAGDLPVHQIRHSRDLFSELDVACAVDCTRLAAFQYSQPAAHTSFTRASGDRERPLTARDPNGEGSGVSPPMLAGNGDAR